MSRAIDHVILTATALASPAGCIISLHAVPTTTNFERGISLKKKKKFKSGIQHSPNMSEDQDLLSKISQLAGKLNDAIYLLVRIRSSELCYFRPDQST